MEMRGKVRMETLVDRASLIYTCAIDSITQECYYLLPHTGGSKIEPLILINY